MEVSRIREAALNLLLPQSEQREPTAGRIGMKDQEIKDLRFTCSVWTVKKVEPNCIRKVVSSITHYHFPPALQMPLGWMLDRLGAGFRLLCPILMIIWGQS